MRPMSGRTAIVIGGSIAGLLAALLLRRDGWTVDVFERVQTGLTGRGAGIVTHPELFEVLRSAGIEVTPELGVQVQTRRLLDRNGDCTAELDMPQVVTSWDRLYHELRRKLPDDHYHNGRILERIDAKNDVVTARFTDGGSISADLLVAADGFRSVCRSQFFPTLPLKYAGYIAWRGLVDEALISVEARTGLFEHFAFSLPEGEQMLGYPVAGVNNDMRVGHRRYNWVWYRPADEHVTLRNLLTDQSGLVHELSIAPPLIRPDIVAVMRQASEDNLSWQFQELVGLTAQPFFQPVYDLETERMAIGRVAIIGDAAFVVRPHVGAGVTKAAQDALSLAVNLGNAKGDVRSGLLAFERDRLPVGKRIVAQARHLGAYMRPQSDPPEQQRVAEILSGPDAVMRETASLAFLRSGIPCDSNRASIR